MSSWTRWEPRLNSIATHARLWAGDADATHPKNRSSSMTSVTGSPAGNHVPAYTCASWSVTIVLPSIVALRVRASTVSRTVPSARRQGLVLCVPTILAPRPPRSAVVQGDCWVSSPMGCQACKDLQTLTRSTQPRGDRTHERDSQSTCEPAYERLAALLPGRRSLLPPGSATDSRLP